MGILQHMGCGVSVHKKPDSAMKFGSSNGSKPKKIFTPSPTKVSEDPTTQFGFKSQSSVTPPLTSFREIGSKEETFFDSEAWLDSDCDDDFLSMNGDFTPSRGSTSNHLTGYPQHNTPDFNTHPSLPSPTDKKKKLSELLQDSLGGDDDQNIPGGELENKQKNLIQPSKSTNGFTNLFPYLSRSSSVRNGDRTPNRPSKTEKEKSMKANQCCLPSLITSLSFSERKKRLSPDVNGAG